MAKIRNVSGNDLVVPSLGGRLVLAGQIVEVDDEAVYGFTQQAPNWEPADDATQAVHDAAIPAEEVPATESSQDAEPRADTESANIDVAPATGDAPPATDEAPATDTTTEG